MIDRMTRLATRGRAAIAVAAVTLLVAAIVATRDSTAQDPCTQADLDRPSPATMPTPERVEQRRKVNRELMDPVAAGYEPAVEAEPAWAQLHAVQPATGGGRDELLLGLFTGRSYSRVPAWALLSHRRAQPLDPLPLPAGVKPNPRASPCVFVDVLTVFNIDTGQRFFGSTVTSGKP